MINLNFFIEQFLSLKAYKELLKIKKSINFKFHI